MAEEIAESQYSVLIASEANLLGGFDSMGATLKNSQIMTRYGVNLSLIHI